MRSVVLEPPALRTVVLRKGPPKPAGGRWDAVAGIVGALAIVAATVMVFTLPDHEPILPNFQVEIQSIRVNYTFDGGGLSLRQELAEGEEWSVAAVMPENVNLIIVDVGVEDDMPTSLADRLQVRLFDPFGRQVEQALLIATPAPAYDDASLAFRAVYSSSRLVAPLGTLPENGFVRGGHAAVTSEDVRQEYLRAGHIASNGTWSVTIALLDAGDCPDEPSPTDPAVSILRAAECRRDSDGTDAGNAVDLQGIQYTYFDVLVSEV